jgi:hypothetical protein
VKVNDLLLSLRAKLNDERVKKQWSDEELIDNINSALSALTEDLNPWDDGEWIIPLTNNKSRYELPPYFFALSSVFINGKRLPRECILGYKAFKNIENPRHTIVANSINNLHIKPAVFNKEYEALKKEIEEEKYMAKKAELTKKLETLPTDVMKVYFDREEQVAYKEDIINLPDRFKDAIVFYCMHLAHQNPVREDGDNKSVFYLNLYDKKVSRLKSSVYRNKHSKRLRSKHIAY